MVDRMLLNITATTSKYAILVVASQAWDEAIFVLKNRYTTLSREKKLDTVTFEFLKCLNVKLNFEM